jgi:hypothetical protein
MDIEAAAPHLIEPCRLVAVLFRWAPGDSIETDVRSKLPFVFPHVVAVLALHDPRRLRLVLRRQVPLKHVGRLNDVVIDADENHFVYVHKGVTFWVLTRVR